MQISPLTQLLNVVLRYKLLHIAFWIYQAITFFHVIEERFGKHPMNYWDAGIITGMHIVLVYFVLYKLIPATLEKRKYLAFVLGALLSLILSVAITLFFQDLATLAYFNRHLRSYNIIPKFISGSTDSFVLLSLFCAVYAIKDKYNSERNKALQEKENLKAELDFLKNQLNPHFLFNAINSIYFLIRQDRDLAEKTLLEFSGLLRYQLYECSNDQTLLEKELLFIKDYVELEKIRNDQSLSVTLDIAPIENDLKIAPFILITFVENAFKHKSESAEKNFIDISASVKDTFLIFKVNNSTGDTISQTAPGGIGLRNVQRRLELLYPKKHRLTIAREANVFSINLELNLDPS